MTGSPLCVTGPRVTEPPGQAFEALDELVANPSQWVPGAALHSAGGDLDASGRDTSTVVRVETRAELCV